MLDRWCAILILQSHPPVTMGVIFCFSLFMAINLKGGFFMSRIKFFLSTYTGKIYVYLATEDVGKQFLQDAENEGFTFCDGIKPTERTPANIIAINRDMTINYVGFVGRIAYQASNIIGNEPLVKIDYREIISCSQ